MRHFAVSESAVQRQLLDWLKSVSPNAVGLLSLKTSIPIPALALRLSYDRETGVFFWKERGVEEFSCEGRWKAWNKRFCGQPAGTQCTGYVSISVQHDGARHRLLAHRAAWAIENGAWPLGEIDHIDGDRANNRIENLRHVTRHDNTKNRALPSNNTSGCIGVIWGKDRGLWSARIKVEGKTIHLGRFKQIEDAVAARKAAEGIYGFHENHGRPL